MSETMGFRVAERPKMAVVVPIGRGTRESWRAIDLMRSLVAWEPQVEWCVIVDDEETSRGLSELKLFPSTCRAVTVVNERHGRGNGRYGGLSVGIMSALEWIHMETDAEFVLKIDTDAFVIGPFVKRVFDMLRREPDCGLAGTVGDRCNPSEEALRTLQRESIFVKAYRLLATDLPGREGSLPIGPLDRARAAGVPIDQAEVFMQVLSHVEDAMRHGFWWDEYCQGGAYVISRTMIDRMASAGYLAIRRAWIGSRLGEDRVMGMYARAVGMRVRNYSGCGEPFGIHYPGLAAEPSALVDAGYALIHSVKNYRNYKEVETRNFFRKRLPKT